MPKSFRLTTFLVLVLTVMGLILSACGDTATPSTSGIGQGAVTTVAQAGQTSAAGVTAAAGAGNLTDQGTPRNETLIVQTFDGKTATPDQQNPLNAYAVWRGFRELGWSYLWEDDTSTGKSYPELADGFPEVIKSDNTQFRIKIRQGVMWSDGVEFTTDDVIYTLDTMIKNKAKLSNANATTISNYVKSYKAVDKYTFEVETQKPAFDLVTVLGVYTWASPFIIVPKHVFEKQADVTTFKNTNPVTLGPYTIKAFDPNGFWQIWQLRDDWQKSGWGNLGQPKAKYVYYKDFGTEETRTLAFSKNQYDIDTFMSPDSIAAAKAKNSAVQTFAPTLPYNDMNDACSYGVYINQQKAPLDKSEVRWALALTLNLQQVGITSVNGQFKASALPMADTPITKGIYVDPLTSFMKELKLADGYQPFNANFGADLVAKLKAQGIAEADLPKGDDVTKNFGVGWWKNDPAEAEKLLNSVGMKKGSDGFYTMADGKTWELEFVIPGDWNKVMQRIGFAIADSWKKAGIKVNTRQVDNGEFTTVTNTNSKLQVMLQWGNSCVYNANFLSTWRSIRADNVKDVNSSEALSGNLMRITDPEIFKLVADAGAMEVGSAPFVENGKSIAKKLVTGMQMINIMNIPTTIPTNNFYWKNYSKQDNFYAAPYSWWSSFKKTLVSIQPTGQK